MLEIVPYRSSWPVEFKLIAASLRVALRDLAVRIDHIGSTSVPVLAAKDIILLFRDYLRTHPAVADDYAALKQTLAHYHGDDRLTYTLIKDPVCDVIMGAAEEWALTTHWLPGPSDA